MNYSSEALNLLDSTQTEVRPVYRENRSPYNENSDEFHYAPESRNKDVISENATLRESILNTIKNCKMQKSQFATDRWISMDVAPEINDNTDVAPEINDNTSSNDDNTSESLAETSENKNNNSDCVTIKEERSDTESICISSAVQVKVETISTWTETDFLQPFFKDMNAVLCDDASLKIDSSRSVQEAVKTVKEGLNTDMFFECPHCGLVFKHPKKFLVHVKWHSFGLIIDKKSEVAKEKVSRHRQKKAKLEQKTNQKKAKKDEEEEDVGENLPCKDCDKTFKKKSDLKYHRYRTHSTHTHTCKKCGTVISGYAAFRAHVAAHVANADGYQCPECPKSFKFHRSLVKHQGTHMEKTHECEECHRKFGTDALLKIHQRYHAVQSASYRCSYCSKRFLDSYHLEAHEKIHKDEKPYHCDMCNMGFVRQYSLKKHMEALHGQSASHECTVCGRTFQAAAARNRHEARSHRGRLVLPCLHCCRRFQSDEDLQKHVQKEHCRIAQQA